MKKTFMTRFLDMIEWGGNKLPDPLTLFFSLAAMILLLSVGLSAMDVQVVNPANGATIQVVNLLDGTGVQKILGELVKNFALFPPFAVVLVCMLGIGVAEKSGLINSALKKTVTIVPASLLPATLVFCGIMSNMASDAGYVVLTPLGAVLFAAFGRHPIAGLTAAFAGVSGGFSANLVVSSLDPMLGGLSTNAAQLINPDYNVLPTANYYFMVVSTFFITAVGTFVTTKIVEPRLGVWKKPAEFEETSSLGDLSNQEKKALNYTLIYGVIAAAVLAFITVPEGALLRDAKGELGPFYNAVVPIIMILFLLAGIVYGVVAGTIKSDKDVSKMMSQTMSGLGPYIVLSFICAQFVAFFTWSNIGMVVAIKGAEVLKTIGLTGVPLFLSFILVTAFLNLFMGSASAKWAIMAPIFVPMFMMLGYSPELVQNSYRIGDSVTNIISPLLPYFPIILAFAKKYKPDLGMGTLISLMIPYSISFAIMWAGMFIIWFLAGWPIGPGAPLFYP